MGRIKLIAFICAASMAVTMTSACSSSETATNDTQAVSVEETSASAEADLSASEENLSAEEEDDDEILEGAAFEEEEAEAQEEEEPAIDMRKVEAGTVIDLPEDADLSDYFCAYKIHTKVYNRINGRSYRENPNISLNDLRYLKVIHYNYNHEVQVGEIIVNKAIKDDCLEIFQELFENGYEINSMHLIDNYWTGDGESSDYASIDVDNTSCFCYRTATASSKLSNHAYGRAIDLNPLENPYVSYSSGSAKWAHSNADAYIDRDSGLAHVITHDDLAYKIFTEHGFSWGGDWDTVKDYQHFEKEN